MSWLNVLGLSASCAALPFLLLLLAACGFDGLQLPDNARSPRQQKTSAFGGGFGADGLVGHIAWATFHAVVHAQVAG
jgi:hypothetical protein